MRNRARFLLVVLLSVAAYAWIGYGVKRHESASITVIFLFVSAGYWWLMTSRASSDLWLVFGAAVLMRAVFLFSVPTLSDDVYRFLWDGWLWHHGHDPFLHTPDEFMAAGIGEPGLYALLGHKDTHTVYPVIPMGLARMAVLVSDDLIIRIFILRLANLIAEAGTLMLLARLVRKGAIPALSLAAYALNPLVIIELTGNLHHEALVVFFMVASLSFLLNGKDLMAGLMFAGAIGSKLLPLIFLTGWWSALGRRRGTKFTVIAVVAAALVLVPQLSGGFFSGMGSGLGLYFNRFEFNASLWYLIREVGFRIAGFNIIRWAGPVMVATGGMLILILSIRKQSVSELVSPIMLTSLIALGVYLLFATTVHPWYLAPMVLFAVPAGYRFPLVWSCLALFTYVGYSRTGYSEVSWLVAVEYLVVAFIFLMEWKQKRSKKN